MTSKHDPYARVEYRRLVAWKSRIAREGPYLLATLGAAPERSVVDLGCGTGEHVAFLAGEGFRAAGLDGSESMLARARELEAGSFVMGDMLDAPELLADDAPFGSAICLGNVLPHFLEEEQIDGLVSVLARILVPGGVFLTQILNYHRILDQGLRHLPLNFGENEEGGELVFLRLMAPGPDGQILFFPTTLALDPEAEEPVTLKASRRVALRPWTLEDLAPRFEAQGFQIEAFGDMTGGPFDAGMSTDLVLRATRE